MKDQPFLAILLIIGVILWLQKSPWQLRVVWSYFLISTAYRAFWNGYAPGFAPSLSYLIKYNMAYVFGLLALLPLMILNSPKKFKDAIIVAMKWYVAYDCITLLYGGPGLFSAPTFDASVIACFCLHWNFRKKLDWIGILLSAAAIIHVHGRTAAMIVAIMYGVVLLQFVLKKYGRKIFIAALSVSFACASVGLFLYRYKIMGDSRIEMWTEFYKWWLTNSNFYLGSGLGSFEWIGPFLDPGPQYRNKGIGFFVAHNDWFQILFESGYVGLLFAVLGYLFVSMKLRGRDLANWIGIGCGMIFYYVTHAWTIQVLSLILISRVPKKESA